VSIVHAAREGELKSSRAPAKHPEMILTGTGLKLARTGALGSG
jgi:hypothetical protein